MQAWELAARSRPGTGHMDIDFREKQERHTTVKTPAVRDLLKGHHSLFLDAMTDFPPLTIYAADGDYTGKIVYDSEIRQTESDGSIMTVYQAHLEGTPLTMESRCHFFPDTSTLEIDGYIRNPGMEVSPSIKGPFSLCFEFDVTGICGLRTGNLYGGAQTAAVYPPNAYAYTEKDGLFYAVGGRDGRSTEENAPYFVVRDEEGNGGVVMTCEWPGRWCIYYNRLSVRGARTYLSGGIQGAGTCFSLAPGEEAMIPRAQLLFFGKGEDPFNQYRRHFLRHMRRPIPGIIDVPQVFYNHFFNFGNQFNEEILRREADFYAEAGCEYFVVDGGWFVKGFREGIGNWDEPDPEKFPSEIEHFADYVRSKGMRFGLWFEPEFAMENSSWAKKYPQFYMKARFRHLCMGTENHDRLFKMQNFEARKCLLEYLADMVERCGIEWIRWDCNSNPGPFWDQNDPQDNYGKIQNAWCAGLFTFLDEFMERCPKVHIEACAGGGCRMDPGTLRRAHSAWMSDNAHYYPAVRRCQSGVNLFLPGYSNSVMIFSDAADNRLEFGHGHVPWEAVYSKFAGAFGCSEKSSHFTENGKLQLKQMIAEFKAVRHLLLKDFYALFEPASLHDYDGWEFFDTEKGEGIFSIFRCHSTERKIRFHLRGVDPEKIYKVIPFHGTSFTVMGELAIELDFPSVGDCMLYHFLIAD